MISTKDYQLLPDSKTLQTICKALSVLDAILCQKWEYRYYSYNAQWADQEEVCEMRNGQGDQMLILFLRQDCAINGYVHEIKQPHKQQITENLPTLFDEFIFGEPVNTIGTTFCLWTTDRSSWQTGQLDGSDDNSEEMLSIFDGNPQTYIDWASEYYEESGISLKTVRQIYAGQPLTRAMVLSVVDELTDWSQLELDLQEINYPYNFS